MLPHPGMARSRSTSARSVCTRPGHNERPRRAGDLHLRISKLRSAKLCCSWPHVATGHPAIRPNCIVITRPLRRESGQVRHWGSSGDFSGPPDRPCRFRLSAPFAGESRGCPNRPKSCVPVLDHHMCRKHRQLPPPWGDDVASYVGSFAYLH